MVSIFLRVFGSSRGSHRLRLRLSPLPLLGLQLPLQHHRRVFRFLRCLQLMYQLRGQHERFADFARHHCYPTSTPTSATSERTARLNNAYSPRSCSASSREQPSLCSALSALIISTSGLSSSFGTDQRLCNHHTRRLHGCGAASRRHSHGPTSLRHVTRR